MCLVARGGPLYDAEHETFFVNIASPALIIAIDARDPAKISREYEIPVEGPHGLKSMQPPAAYSAPATQVSWWPSMLDRGVCKVRSH